ncbi:MAG: biotin transporter BioY [Candidatus Thermoplasmatota archaeon]|nr:biotin transporter BioY [Candidatus Thermoplasmatota archaeon]
MNGFIEGYKNRMQDFFKWRTETSFVYKLIMCCTFACFTGLMAQVRFYLPFTPVPITGQTFAVLLSGVMLGKYYGGLSQGIYAGLGFAGVPWFAGYSGGIGVLLGPTGGYIIGFILAALFIGYVVDSKIRARSFSGMLGLMLFADIMLILIPGTLWLYIWLNLFYSVSIMEAMLMGFIPFIAGDVLKVFAAGTAGGLIIPKSA